MQVALVQCPAWGAIPPLGAAALKAYVEAAGHQVRCHDLNIDFYNEHHRTKDLLDGNAYGGPDPWGADSYGQWALDYTYTDHGVRFQEGSAYNDRPLPIERWADRVLADRPRIVGFTTYLTSFASSLLLAREIRRRDPSVLIVFGGPNVASDREGDLALRMGIPDVVVDSEGEATLVDLIRCLEEDGDLSGVPGIGLRVDGEPTWTERRPLIAKIDELPYPDFSDFDWSEYPNPYLVPIMSSRGCVLNCAFCYETVYWKRYRMQSPERIVGEIEHVVANHPMRDQARAEGKRFYFMFADSLVNGHVAGLKRLCQLMVDRGVEIHWGGQATINKRMDEDFCRLLAASGCTGLAFGLESGSPKILESMGKHFDVEDAQAMMRQMHAAGVSVTVNVMVGYPTETFRDFTETLLFLRKTRRWIYQVSNVTTTQIALGSDLAVHPEKYGVVVHDDNSWESEETGTEADRRRRLRILHLWMRMFRIPHQNIAPD